MNDHSIDRTPEFNSGIDYLRRIGTIISAGHIAAAERDAIGLFDLSTQLLTELTPRMLTEEIKIYGDMEILLFQQSLTHSADVNFFWNVHKFFRSLNHQVHKKNLGMRDAEAGSGAF